MIDMDKQLTLFKESKILTIPAYKIAKYLDLKDNGPNIIYANWDLSGIESMLPNIDNACMEFEDDYYEDY